jgi:hypothetical protein
MAGIFDLLVPGERPGKKNPARQPPVPPAAIPPERMIELPRVLQLPYIPRPGEVAVRPEAAPLVPAPPPRARSPFEMLIPAARPPALPAIPEKPSVFEMLIPRAPEPTVERPSAFEMLIPGRVVDLPAPPALPPGAPAFDPFDILVEPAPGVPRPPPRFEQATLFDVLAPEAPEVEEIEAGIPEPDEPYKGPVRDGEWVPPTPEELVRAIQAQFTNLEGMWDSIRVSREDPWYLEMKANEDYSGEPAIIPLETIGYVGDDFWNELASIFMFDPAVFEPYERAFEKAAEEQEDDWEIWEDMRENVLWPLYNSISNAFDRIRPPDLRGHIMVENYEDQTVLAYWEELSEEEKARLGREAEFRREEEGRKRRYEQEQDRKKRAEQRAKREEILRGWKPPTQKKILEIVDAKLDLDAIFDHVRKKRGTKKFKEALKEQELVSLELEEITRSGEEFYDRFARFFEVPEHVMRAYEEWGDEDTLQEEILNPIVDRARKAINAAAPEDLPGEFVIDWAEEDEESFLLQYIEEGGA